MEVKISDLAYFKNEILEDLKKLEKRLNEKMNSNINLFLENINTNKEIISEQNSKIFEVMNTITKIEEKLKLNSDLSLIESKLDHFTMYNNSKLASLEKEINDVSFKYDRIFVQNLTCPGLIGNHCQYSNSRAFFESIDKRLKELVKSKDAQNKDNKMYKDKLEALLNQFKLEMNSIDPKISLHCNELLHKYELRNNEKLLDMTNKLNNVRVEFENFTSNLNKKMEELDLQCDKMKEFRDNLFENVENKLSKIAIDNQKTEKEHNEFMDEFNKIKSQFDETQKALKNIQLNERRNTTYNYKNYIDNNMLSQEKYNSKNANEKNNKNNNNEKSINNENNKSNSNSNDENENKNELNKDEINVQNKSNDITTIKIKLNKNANKNPKYVETQVKNEIIASKNIDIKENLNESTNKEISNLKNKEISNIYLKKENNMNRNSLKIQRSSIKENLKLIKKEFLKRELNKLVKNKRNSSLINNSSSNLKEYAINNQIKEDNNKMNKTITKRILLRNGTSLINSTNPDISNISDINPNKTRFNFYQNLKKKEINGLKNNESTYKNDKYENSRYQNLGESNLPIFNYNKNNEKKSKMNNSMNEIYLGNNPKYYKINQNICLNNNISIEDEQYLNKDEFYEQMNETKENLNYLYLKLDLKIQKIKRQIKNLAAEVFQYSFNKKLNNKYLSLITKNKSANKIVSSNSPKAKILNERKQNLKKFPRINDNLTFTEDEKISSKDFLEQIDSFLIKKLKD